VVVQVRVVKISLAAVQALRKKEVQVPFAILTLECLQENVQGELLGFYL